MKHYLNTAAVMMNTIILVVALPVAALGSLDSEQVGNFPEADSTKLVHHHGQLFALVSDSAGLSVYVADRQIEDWTEIDSTAPTVSDFIEESASLTTFGIYQGSVYTGAVNNDGVAQIWKICKHCRPATWEQSGSAGLGDSDNTAIMDFFKISAKFYAVTENANGNGLFVTEDGDTWTQVGSYGLGVGVTDAVRAGRVGILDHTIRLASASGIVYQADPTDLTSWTTLATLDGTITALRHRFLATEQDGVATVYESDDDGNYVQIGETIDGTITRFVLRRWPQRPGVLVSSETAGASYQRLDNDGSTWNMLLEGGYGNANNTGTDSFISFRAQWYATTINSVEGPEIYKIARQ